MRPRRVRASQRAACHELTAKSTFANDEDSSDDEHSSENDNDDPEGRGEEGDGGRETFVEGADSSDEDDGGKFVLHRPNRHFLRMTMSFMLKLA